MSRVALLADASPQAQQLGGRALTELGWRVAAAADAEAALSALRAGGIELVVADARLPGGGGEALADRMAAHPEWAALPLIFTHGGLEAAGAPRPNAVWLRKPLAPAALAEALARWFASAAAAAGPAGGAAELLRQALREALGG